ncbi:heterocyst development glycosyltransferase HepC [Nostoc sp. FACHB-110]|uniref:heterocyst development glycosyltransferase HepC n=1 Tax=Nostoc sp. FACHB-110 TaxID=2692834 RepID=UPI00168649FD|nr:heterocyst development glycosyltransferase HepC [Nostoc sp. FACHB-110]MBD2439675.1 sugar transferase [Nostoc sp. FACHB-110]
MTTSAIRTLQTSYTLTQQPAGHRTSYCTLQWRRGQLLVKSAGKLQQPYLPAVENHQLLVNCLQHSPINLVTVDPKIGENWVRFWADACEEAHKPMFLCGSSENFLFKQNSQPWGWLVRLIDWFVALVMLLLLSPTMLLLLLLLQISSPEALVSREWYVGERGKLFRAIKFSITTKRSITPLGRWMCRYGLDNLPHLLNMLRGEMGFIGSRCWKLEAAVKSSFERELQLNQLPVMTNAWPVQAESNLIINNP